MTEESIEEVLESESMTSDEEITLLTAGNCDLSAIGAAFLVSRGSVSEQVRDLVELFICCESGINEWSLSDFRGWLEQNSPLTAERFNQAESTPGDTVPNRSGGSVWKSISQQIANATNLSLGWPIIRVQRGTYCALEVEIDDILSRQRSRLSPRESDSHYGVSDGVTVPNQQAPSTIIELPSTIQSHLATNEEQSNHNPVESRPQGTEGYLYLAYNTESFDGWIKAGVSTTQDRLNQYQTADPHRAFRPIAFASISATETMPLYGFEAQLHILLKQRATQRGVASQTRHSEWFQISHESAIDILQNLHPDSFILDDNYAFAEGDEECW